MAELRAPDPTLTDHGIGLVGVDWSNALLTAHELRPALTDDIEVQHACTGEEAYDVQRANECRWFAVPCRECFPGAPPPGKGVCPCGEPTCTKDTPAGLAWQVREVSDA